MPAGGSMCQAGDTHWPVERHQDSADFQAPQRDTRHPACSTAQHNGLRRCATEMRWEHCPSLQQGVASQRTVNKCAGPRDIPVCCVGAAGTDCAVTVERPPPSGFVAPGVATEARRSTSIETDTPHIAAASSSRAPSPEAPPRGSPPDEASTRTAAASRPAPG
eukprot:TRINITY_DN69744_c0_g1_i1.p1 TRINITY_DN69744_c0_g1~~TRINITY_DN69744_c0_g1_i1.p1  ORF type:complete len:163 (+),score=6.20 TRINITY_DN69744_c0_g1_i1:649-1137(+)